MYICKQPLNFDRGSIFCGNVLTLRTPKKSILNAILLIMYFMFFFANLLPHNLGRQNDPYMLTLNTLA